MPDEANRPGEYTNKHHGEVQGIKESETEISQYEDMRYIEETIRQLTGGCEVCQHAVGPFCKKHNRPIEPGASRCDDFARRLPKDPGAASKAQVHKFVYGTLGVRDKENIKRLTGET
jgi:hypothetical protein